MEQQKRNLYGVMSEEVVSWSDNFWTIYLTKMFKQQKKIRNSLHHSQTSTKVQQEERKMKRDKMKEKEKI